MFPRLAAKIKIDYAIFIIFADVGYGNTKTNINDTIMAVMITTLKMKPVT